MSKLQRALEQRRGTLERAADITGGLYIAEGSFEVLRTGEATVDIQFPVTYTEMPHVHATGAAGENQQIVPGEFPEWNVGVLRWDRIVNRSLPDSVTYRGCTLIVRIRGAASAASTFQSVIFWTASGIALTNPIVGGL